MKKWIEKENADNCNYEMVCPVCGFSYSPTSNPDGTISPSEIYKSCPKCGEKLLDPSADTRW